jgi:dipeptidyl aminopeptidase/acylaminoacyl peptidase
MKRMPFLLAVVFATVAASGAFAEKQRPITEKDLFQFKWVADPQISPDGSRVAYTKVTINADKDAYETSLWLVSAGGREPQRLTHGPRDGSPRWSPDGNRLAFIRSEEKDGKPQPPQIFLLTLTGGEPVALTTLSQGATTAAWSPDGKRIAFMSSMSDEDLAKEKKKDAKPEHESDVRIVNRAIFRIDNQGYEDTKHLSHIWVVAVPGKPDETATPKQITKGIYEEGFPTWSPDGTRIYFLADRSLEPYYDLREDEIFSVSSDGGVPERIASVEGGIGPFAVSRDGKHIAFQAQLLKPIRSYSPLALFVVDTTPGAVPRNLTAAFEYDIGDSVSGDQHPPRGGGSLRPVWTQDGSGVIAAVTKEGRCNLHVFDAASGDVRQYTSGDQDVFAFSASSDGSRVALAMSTPTKIGDIFIADGASPPKQLTHINDQLFSELNLTPPEEIWYTSFDGKKINAYLQKPPDFDPKKKYPLILDIHGGPHVAYGYTFDHEFQWMAAKGYLVLYPNPRGSSSYGREFGNIIQYRYPGDDFKDLMAGVDAVIRRGYVDPKKLAVTGGSGGGLLTNWTITHTDRFAAAASQRSIADWAAWWYEADFTLFHPLWFRKAPFEDPQEYAERSPITKVADVKTPLMLVEGEADYRTPSGSGGETMFRALKYLKKPVVMVRFPGESHELSRSGKPWHRIERLEHIVNWFDKYLQGKPMPQYDLRPPEEKSAKR